MQKIGSLKGTCVMFWEVHTLALMWTKIGRDLLWHMGEKAPVLFKNFDIY